MLTLIHPEVLSNETYYCITFHAVVRWKVSSYVSSWKSHMKYSLQIHFIISHCSNACWFPCLWLATVMLTYQPVGLEMAHLLPELWKSGSVISAIRPAAMGVCVGRENTCNDDELKCFLEAQIICVKPSSRSIQHMSIVTCGWNFIPVYIIHELNLVSCELLMVKVETIGKIIWVQVWFPKRRLRQ